MCIFNTAAARAGDVYVQYSSSNSRGCAFLIQQQQEQGMCMFNTAAATAGDVHF
jgi:hypothetical protein